MILEKDEKIIVTELKPMSELMLINDFSKFVLAYKDSKQDFVRVRQSSNDEIYCSETGRFHNINKFNGWIEIVYQPELKVPDRSQPQCTECGAMTVEQALEMCTCDAENDICHGNELYG